MECMACFSNFTAQGDQLPLVLSCGHSLCLACVRQLTGKSLAVKCPVCRSETNVPADELTTLANRALVGLIESSQSGKTQIVKCDECEKTMAHVFCQNCEASLCNGCFENLHTAKTLKKHTTTSVDSNNETWCKTHNKEVEAFCHTCNTTICATCAALGSCKGHAIQGISEVEVEQRKALKDQTTDLQQYQEQISQLIQHIETLAKETNVSAHEASQSIKHVMARLRVAIDKREQEMLEQVSQQCKATLKALDLHKNHLQMMQGCVVNLMKSRNELPTNDNSAATGKQKLSSKQFVRRVSSHMTQTKSFLAQCPQLSTINITHLLPNYSHRIHVTTKQMQQESSTIIDILEKRFEAVVSIDASKLEEDISNQIGWKAGECVALDEFSVKLCWSGVHSPDNDFAKKNLKFRYSIRHNKSGDNFNSDSAISVYEGFDEQCVVGGLQTEQEHEFELSVGVLWCDGETQSNGGHIVLQLPCKNICRVRTLTNVPRFTELHPSMNVTADGMTVTRIDKPGCDGYATSDILPSQNVVWWKVKMLRMTSPHVMAGIISTNTNKDTSRNSKTAFLWYDKIRKYEDGVQSKPEGWAGWAEGDEAVMKLDRVANTLTMKHMRTNALHSTNVTPNLQWKVHVIIYNDCVNGCVQVMPATLLDRF
eukprot:c11481_g2_i1.p1 GENE.c11481_g2_i1~~c11481_g2_i1.p1  ORF type:complete len:662 (+),score=171.97 c11481_g2_i1:28-1986(+)